MGVADNATMVLYRYAKNASSNTVPIVSKSYTIESWAVLLRHTNDISMSLCTPIYSHSLPRSIETMKHIAQPTNQPMTFPNQMTRCRGDNGLEKFGRSTIYYTLQR